MTGRVEQRQDMTVSAERASEALVERIFAGEKITVFASDATVLHALIRARAERLREENF